MGVRYKASFVELPKISLETLSGNNISIENVYGSTLIKSITDSQNIKDSPQGLQMIGTLGYAVFAPYSQKKRTVVKLDFKENELTIYSYKYFKSNSRSILKGFKLISSGLVGRTSFGVPTTINGKHRGKMRFDTGNPTTFSTKGAYRNATIKTNGIFLAKQKYIREAKPSNAFVKGSGGDFGYLSMKGHIFILDYIHNKLYVQLPTK